ncbi:hypothetical protein IFM89_021027 [Coptis chinensis]|uniref:Uncharacterized protein n=1 Tax=Coptis chinensis TaxID=261450 RepID=A0A835H5Z5_9MAGN|nr:hypothetical protein IFM89_021027 [Coptis chinensis]
MFSSRSLSRFADIVSLCIQTELEFRPTMSDIVESLELLNDRSSADGLSFYIRYEAAITLKNSCLSLKDVALGDILQIFNIVVTLKKWNVVHANDWQPITITVGYGGGVLHFRQKLVKALRRRLYPSVLGEVAEIRSPDFVDCRGKDLTGKEIEDPLPENSNYSFTTPQIWVLGLAALSCWCKCMYLSKLEHLRSVSLSDFP